MEYIAWNYHHYEVGHYVDFLGLWKISQMTWNIVGNNSPPIKWGVSFERKIYNLHSDLRTLVVDSHPMTQEITMKYIYMA